MIKCEGCGIPLQQEKKDELGYTKNMGSKLCERCFRIRHYGDYRKVTKNNEEYVKILKYINHTKDLVLLVVDLFHMNENFHLIQKELKNNPILLVLTKRDLLPKNIYEEKLIGYMKQFHLQAVDCVIISSTKNYQFDLLMKKIRQYQSSKDVYVVGYTNAGKSTMMNQIIYHYSDLNRTLTTSMLPSTTLTEIKVPIDDELTLIDTPGILEEGSILNQIDTSLWKRVLPKKEIRPITYQVKKTQTFLITGLLQLECQDDNNLTFYVSNQLLIERKYQASSEVIGWERHLLKVKGNQDIVITGLGFIKVMKMGTIIVDTLPGVNVYLRDAFI